MYIGCCCVPCCFVVLLIMYTCTLVHVCMHVCTCSLCMHVDLYATIPRSPVNDGLSLLIHCMSTVSRRCLGSKWRFILRPSTPSTPETLTGASPSQERWLLYYTMMSLIRLMMSLCVMVGAGFVVTCLKASVLMWVWSRF